MKTNRDYADILAELTALAPAAAKPMTPADAANVIRHLVDMVQGRQEFPGNDAGAMSLRVANHLQEAKRRLLSSDHDYGGQAFPGVEAQIGNMAVGSPGMSLLQYFAAHAPAEVPKWFKHPDAEKVPGILRDEEALQADADWPALTEQEQNDLRDWMADPTYDPYTELMTAIGRRAQRRIGDREREIKAARNHNRAAKWFAWRWHYARQMVLGAGR